ncbi:MAG: PAS domain-containing protein [bacterium]|nr:PAS domain-containing protein [bacterium]
MPHFITRDILDKAPFGIYIVNDDGNIEYANPAIIKMSGDALEQFMKLKIFELPTYKQLGLDEKIRLAMRGESFSMGPVEYTSYYSKKTTIRKFTGIPFKEEGAKKVVIFVEDITDLKRAEEELVRRMTDLEKFNKVAVDRELKMIELKNKIKELEAKSGGLTGPE